MVLRILHLDPAGFGLQLSELGLGSGEPQGRTHGTRAPYRHLPPPLLKCRPPGNGPRLGFGLCARIELTNRNKIYWANYRAGSASG